MPIGAFRRHLEHLVANYQVLSLSEVVSHLRQGSPLPKDCVVLTFDDGYRSCYELAHPLLTEFGVPATLFVATDFVLEKRPLWHDRVEYAVHATRETEIDVTLDGVSHHVGTASMGEKLGALKLVFRHLKGVDQDERDVVVDALENRAGVRLDLSDAPDVYRPIEISELKAALASGILGVGSHTKTHAVLSKCRTERLTREISVSKRVIEDATDRVCDLFCYPNGKESDFNAETKRALAEAGFVCALTTVPGKNRDGADPMELRRFGAPRDQAEFAIAVSGLRSELARFYRRGVNAFGRSQAGQ